MTYRVIVTHESGSSLVGKQQVFSKGLIRVGRRPENDVAFDVALDRSVAGYHVELLARDDGVWVRDVGAANGVYVDDQRVHGSVRIAPGQAVSLGRQGPVIRISWQAPTPTGPAPGPPAPAADRPPPALAPAAPPPLARTPHPALAPAPFPPVAVHAPPPPLAPAGPTPPAAPAAPAPPAKEAVGKATLQWAIERATTDERRRGRRALGAVVGGVLLLAIGGGLLYLGLSSRVGGLEARVSSLVDQLDRRLTARLDEHEAELRRLEGTVSEQEGKVARLVVAIGGYDEELARLAQPGLDATVKAAVEREVREKTDALRRELEAEVQRLRSSGGAGGGDGVWAQLAERYREGIFLCVAQDPSTGQGGIGTAFAISEGGLLATNAHVAAMFDEMPQRVVIQNGTGRIFQLRRWKLNPRYSGPASPDVALVDVDTRGARLPALPLASDAELRESLRIGAHLGTLGYPGELDFAYLTKVMGQGEGAIVATAMATFKDGWVGRLTDFEMAGGPWERTPWVQHSASLSGGTSGSPMFDARGRVVAINNAGLDLHVMVSGGGSDDVGVKRVANAAEIGFAIRVDELRRLRQEVGW